MLNDDIRLFLAIVQEGSLAAAARVFGLSPAMVSKRLARLEQRLGTSLLHRTTRRLELTAKGERYHADMVALAAASENARLRLSGSDEQPQGLLRVTAPASFARLYIAPTLGRFIDAYPRVELDLHLTDEITDLLAARIDLAVRISTTVGPGLEATRLASNRRLLCASPTYLARRGTPASPADLADHDLLATEYQLPWTLVRPGQVVRIDGRSRVRTNSSEIVRELAIAGVGIALRSLWDVNSDLAAGRLVPVLPEFGGSANMAIYAVRPSSITVSSSVRAFETHLQQILSSPPWEAPGASG